VERKPKGKTVSLRTETAYKANGPGQVAPPTEAPGAGSGVKAEAVQLQFAFFSGETSIPGTPHTGSGTTGNRRVAGGGVSRGHTTARARAGRPEPVGWDSTPNPRPTTVILPDRSREPPPCGGPPGGPWSPWLANGMLDDVDVEWARRGLRFSRDADDVLSFVRSQRAATRVLRRSSRFLEGRLRRRINPTKSQATRLSACS
jgi:hypothetical protein